MAVAVSGSPRSSWGSSARSVTWFERDRTALRNSSSGGTTTTRREVDRLVPGPTDAFRSVEDGRIVALDRHGGDGEDARPREGWRCRA